MHVYLFAHLLLLIAQHSTDLYQETVKRFTRSSLSPEMDQYLSSRNSFKSTTTPLKSGDGDHHTSCKLIHLRKNILLMSVTRAFRDFHHIERPLNAHLQNICLCMYA